MSRYKSVRHDKLNDVQTEAFRADAEECRRRMIPYLISLRPQNAAYVAIAQVVQALERAEVEATGKTPGWALGHSAGQPKT